MNSNQRPPQAIIEEARQLLDANPDLIFEERIRIEIPSKFAEFMLKFSSEWGGTLYLLDEMNQKRYENGMLDHSEYEYARRTYRLGLITLSTLYDNLKAWYDNTENHTSSYFYSMNSLDCFFIPGYMEDYNRVHPAGQSISDMLINEIKLALSGPTSIEEAVRAIETMVGEYIRNIHLYAGRG
jgi:hypothetical protein